MDTYSFLRQLADSWAMLAIFTCFVGISLWAFLPSQNKARDDARQIPFRHDSAPAQSRQAQPKGQSDD